ncbi:MAG: hypothetical protein LBD75_03765 [Candidatus Peribacteria bacterium]|jgi:hypothetical protein|nr:hypothetical protein [Candidatus Peribacteria bacterium]
MKITLNTFVKTVIITGILAGQPNGSQTEPNTISANLLNTLFLSLPTEPNTISANLLDTLSLSLLNTFPESTCTIEEHVFNDSLVERFSAELPTLLTNTLLTFFDTEVKAFKLNKKSKERLRDEFKKYFSQHQVFEIKNGKIYVKIDDALAKDIYQHFFPLMMDILKDNVNWIQWILIEIFMGTSLQEWSKVKKDFATKNLKNIQNDFIDDFGGIFRTVNIAITQQYNVKMMTI